MLAPRHASARGGPKTLLARATERPRAGAGAQGTDAACARACGCGDAVTLGALRRRRPTPTLTPRSEPAHVATSPPPAVLVSVPAPAPVAVAVTAQTPAVSPHPRPPARRGSLVTPNSNSAPPYLTAYGTLLSSPDAALPAPLSSKLPALPASPLLLPRSPPPGPWPLRACGCEGVRAAVRPALSDRNSSGQGLGARGWLAAPRGLPPRAARTPRPLGAARRGDAAIATGAAVSRQVSAGGTLHPPPLLMLRVRRPPRPRSPLPPCTSRRLATSAHGARPSSWPLLTL